VAEVCSDVTGPLSNRSVLVLLNRNFFLNVNSAPVNLVRLFLEGSSYQATRFTNVFYQSNWILELLLDAGLGQPFCWPR
jgi:hypothetical protein